MALGSDDAQAAQRFDFFMVFSPLRTQSGYFSIAFGLRCGFKLLKRLDHFFNVSAKYDVCAAACHVGGNGDHAGLARLCHDVSLTRMLFGIQHLVRQLFRDQQLVNDFRIFNRRGADQYRLAALVAFANIFDRRLVLFTRGFVYPVKLVFAFADAIRRDDGGLKTVNFRELKGLGIGRAGHACQLGIETEIVLKCDRRQGLVFSLDLYAFLGLYCLVQAIAPAAAGHQPAGKFIHNHNLFAAAVAVLDNVVLVAVVQVVSAQRSIQVVHQRDVGGVVQA